MLCSDSLRALWCDVSGNSVVLWEIRVGRLMNCPENVSICEVKDEQFQLED